MNTKSFFSIILLSIIAVCFSNCGNNQGGNQNSLAESASGNLVAYQNSAVNAIQQALPTIMIIPSDNLLNKYDALETKSINGRSYIIRDYSKYLIANPDNKGILSEIQNAFVNKNYPIQSLEQALKQIENREAYDEADDLAKDAKTLLLSTVQPDMIIELDYNSTFTMSKDITNSHVLRYTLTVIDPYTNTVISSQSKESTGDKTTTIMNKTLPKTLSTLIKDIKKSFDETLKRGRNITVRIAVENGSNISLEDTTIDGDTYSDWCVDYIKTHTIKGAYKMQTNTDKELYFVNCRIGLLNADGTQYGVYDWTRDLCKSMRKNLGIKVSNKAQGLGEVLVTISGI